MPPMPKSIAPVTKEQVGRLADRISVKVMKSADGLNHRLFQEVLEFEGDQIATDFVKEILRRAKRREGLLSCRFRAHEVEIETFLFWLNDNFTIHKLQKEMESMGLCLASTAITVAVAKVDNRSVKTFQKNSWSVFGVWEMVSCTPEGKEHITEFLDSDQIPARRSWVVAVRK